ncbi:endothelial lipase-like [Bradysia coprophila]|uniref:endothelial lipase-like n=1 Tax=Bradysia coprophila TaxID=38358 RepID=UPI00187D8B07|nr:endothelial lipase-like [Bradysia coprophila]
MDSTDGDHIKLFVNAYKKTNDFNILLFDWRKLASSMYPSAVWNMPKLGEELAKFILKGTVQGYVITNWHLLGHSLGAHLSGIVGKRIKMLSNGSVILPRISGLDPAGPGFYGLSLGTQRISKNDAVFVDIIHTDAGVLGADVNTGTVDFWPNYGRRLQPGCSLFTEILGCSHSRAVYYWIESVEKRGKDGFTAKFERAPRTEIRMGIDCPTECSEKLRKVPKNSKRFRKTPKGSEKLQKVSKNSERFRKTPKGSEKLRKVAKNSERFRKTPKGSEKLQKVPKNSERFRKTPKGSEKLRKVPKNSERFRKTPKGSEKLQKVPKNSERFRKTLKGSEKLQKVPKNSKRFRKTPKGSEKLRKVPKNSERFRKTPKGSEKLQKVQKNSERFRKTPKGGSCTAAAQEVYNSKIIFHYNSGNDTYGLLEAERILENSNFVRTRRTVLYSHGFMATTDDERNTLLVDAYKNTNAYNILLVDWRELAASSYPTAVLNMAKLSEELAKLILTATDQGYAITNWHVLGHSLGAHLSGIVGKRIKGLSNSSLILSRISGLDPAGPGFYGEEVIGQPISKSDAAFVDIIHTDAGVLGANVNTGTVDFWPNGGKNQPGCSFIDGTGIN